MSRRARPGVTLKLAWRQLLRAKGSSMLVAALIAIPVAGAVAAVTFVESRTPAPEQATTLELGHTQAWIQIAGGPDPSRTQMIDMPYGNDIAMNKDGSPKNPELPPPTSLADADLPGGTETLPLALYGGARMKTPTGIANFSVVGGDSWDPRLAGRFEVLSGHAPSQADEAMASPALMSRLGLKVGDEAVLPEENLRYRITGTMRALDGSTDTNTLFTPLRSDTDPMSLTWFVPAWQPDAAKLAELNHAGYVAYARDLVQHPPAGAKLYWTSISEAEKFGILATMSIAAVFIGVLVGLLSAAAMAVSARRQQRSLAVVTTVGARRSDVFRIVLAQGALLGLAGGLIGAAVGIGGVAIAFAVLDPGVANTFWSSWGLKVPWTAPVIVVFAMLVGVLASLLPARSATHGDALAALRGARRPVRMSRRQPVWGVVILVLGAALIIPAGIVLALAQTVLFWNQFQMLALWVFIGGILLLLLGVIVTGQGVLGVLARLLPRLGSGARLASRDAVANSSRTVPAFAAIAASVAVAAFVLSAVAITGAHNDRNYAWTAPKGSVVVDAWGGAVGHEPQFLGDANPNRIVAVSSTVQPEFGDDGDPIDQRATVASLSMYTPGDPTSGGPAYWSDHFGQPVTVIQPEDLSLLTGIPLTPDELQRYADGGAVATPSDYVGPGDMAHVAIWDAKELTSESEPEPERVLEVPVEVHSGGGTVWQVVLSPAAAKRLGITVVETWWIGLFDQAPSQAVQDRLNADAETASVGTSSYMVRVENGPDPSLPWLVLVLAAVSVIVIAAAAISLGLARIERREDDATLAAVGGTRRLRRAVGAWQALIIVGIGCLLGTGIGVVGAWGLTQAGGRYAMSDLPVLWLLGLAIGLPLAIALVSLLIRPPRADLTRRTAIA
ncbi:FtsX-like permease family protein [uncultured Microbacterium sp.]|uniref:ABC transporter permease n=1 Tax=uncultured Microbacterium sp. TaxID=191216 RepID=UPI002606D636|nr:FtsX-like permease family protein [uncultured Microbacterium sp.]